MRDANLEMEAARCREDAPNTLAATVRVLVIMALACAGVWWLAS